MILSNLTKAIREQNWFAVTLEFLIVIAGVVIGFQITSWNEARQQREDAAVAMTELLEEAEEIIAFIQEDIDRVDVHLQAHDKVMIALSAGDASTLEPGDLREGLESLREYRALIPPRSIYDSLAGSGRISILKNRSVVSALAQYYATLDNVTNATEQFQDYIIQDFENLSHHPGIEVTYDQNRLNRRYIHYDFDVIANDARLMEDLVNLVESQFTFQTIRYFLRDEALEMCAELARAVGRPYESEELPEAETSGSVHPDLD